MRVRPMRLFWGAVATQLFASYAIAQSATSLRVLLVPERCFDTCPIYVTVLANDSTGGLAIDYTGTVTFSCSDPLATLPSPYAFTSADAGIHFFGKVVVLRRLGRQKITVTDGNGLTASQTVLLSAEPASSDSRLPTKEEREFWLKALLRMVAEAFAAKGRHSP